MVAPNKTHESEDMAEGLHRALAVLTTAIRTHELEKHGGEPCHRQRLLVTALVAHEMGITTAEPDSIIQLQVVLRAIEMECPECQKGNN